MTLYKSIVLLFGLFFILCGFIMLFKPKLAHTILTKAASTPFINYAEITIRMIPAIALVCISSETKFPNMLYYFGLIMLITSIILLFVPRSMHHNYSIKSAEIIGKKGFRYISPFSIGIGIFLIYAIL